MAVAPIGTYSRPSASNARRSLNSTSRSMAERYRMPPRRASAAVRRRRPAGKKCGARRPRCRRCALALLLGCPPQPHAHRCVALQACGSAVLDLAYIQEVTRIPPGHWASESASVGWTVGKHNEPSPGCWAAGTRAWPAGSATKACRWQPAGRRSRRSSGPGLSRSGTDCRDEFGPRGSGWG